MKAPPAGWPRISSSVFYKDAGAAIAWLCAAFAFEVKVKIEGEDGSIEHSQLLYGDGLIMVGASRNREGREFCQSPQENAGANTQSLCVQVEDADAHAERAKAAGAIIAAAPETIDYGPDYWADRTYEAIDLEGHHWFFVQRVRG